MLGFKKQGKYIYTMNNFMPNYFIRRRILFQKIFLGIIYGDIKFSTQVNKNCLFPLL